MRLYLVYVVTICGIYLMPSIDAHVALTFPPARKYDLDFLDNSRTKAPCGMPRGDIRTSFLSGSKFNVSWHLGYPHKGGFKIHLLDELERPVLDLTPTIQGSEYVSNDATAQSFQVQLPTNFTCKNCTLRLLRQALEWGPNYKFWSCADVDIKIRKEFRESCSGHGRNLLGRCKCDRLYYGNVCQYRDECFEDSDCGNFGKCVNVNAITSPKQQCYCQLGYFGPGCNKRSPIKSTDIDFGLYNEKKLSDTFRLYWRILKEHKEIEMVMVVNGTSYAGIGWRPRSLTKSCKNFPIIGTPLDTTKNDKNETKSEPNAEPSSEPTAEPKTSPEPTAEPKSEPPPSSELEPSTSASNTTEKVKKSSRRSANPNDEVVKTSVSYQVSTKQSRNKRDAKNEPVAEPTSQPEPNQESETTPEPTTIAEPTPEPKTEPTAEPKSEPEPTAEPKSEPEPTSNPEPNAEPKSEPEPTAEPKSEPEPNSEPEPEPKTEPEPSIEPEPKADGKATKTHSNLQNAPTPVEEVLNPYTPRHDFNPMDCTDMVIGSARGTASRIADYYSRDRSTPRMDNFWGGRNDITAAMGFEKDGVTTIVFRKKIQANEPSDHSIEDDLMHVIWAQGQEPNKYVHVPKSGLETGKASIKDFYKPDELKYHGHQNQRGVTTINFLEKKKAAEPGEESGTSSGTSIQSNGCGGLWKHPSTCNPDNYTCEYSAKWEVTKGDEIQFTITTSHTDTWTGIGFSDNERMSQTDAILGWVDKTGRPFLMDTWILGYNQPLLDNSQNIYNTNGRIVDGVTTLSFSRKRISNDPRDLSFTDDHCLFMMFPVKGGVFNSVNKKIRKHEVVPTVSTERICIKSCGSLAGDLFDLTTTTETPGLGYNVAIKIVELGENFVIPQPGTIQYEDLTNSISENIKPIFNKLPGYRRLVIGDLKEDNKQLVANMNLQLDKEMAEKGRSLSDDPDSNDEQVQKLIQQSIGTGKVGNLRVDPSYLVFEPESLTTNLVNESASEDNSFFKLSETKLYIVLGCIAALVLVAIVQASCTIYKTASKRSSSHKDHLIPNSAWKDYSTANTNYAFDAFEAEEKKAPPQQPPSTHPNGRGRSETLPPKNGRHIQRPTGRPPSVPGQNYTGDTRSLQRPRGPYVANLERTTFSLPRTVYDRHRPTQDMQPDFYFMPSQRKYSGEVVRVYVDYNNQPK